MGDVFRHDAKEVFVEYALRCADKLKVADIIMNLNRKNGYGVRDALIDCAGDCLPEPVIRTMIARLQGLADKDNDEYVRRRHLMLIESLARQIKDAKLFEKTRIASWGKLSTAAIIDIARVYLEGGDVEAAHSWLNKIPEDETFQAYERDKLAAVVTEWKTFNNHEAFKNRIYQDHGRKRSFWSKYEVKR